MSTQSAILDKPHQDMADNNPDISTNKKLYIKTYGCQMNVYDSERIADAMASSGYQLTQNMENADLVVVNTCHIREKAAEKLYSELGRIRLHKDEQKRHGKNMLIAVAGCVGQAEGEAITSRAPFVDIVVGPGSYHQLPAMVGKSHQSEEKHLINLDFTDNDKFDILPESRQSQHGASAFLSIQEGCDKFCSFCVVPYTRGAEFSRPVKAIMNEMMALVRKGVTEVTLLGQNVNAYHGEGLDGNEWSLAQLMRQIAKIPEITRIRYTTSHPRDMSDDLIEAHGDEPKIMPYLHLPIQSGSDKILKAMNRKHNAEEYIRIIEKLRAARPDIALSSDFIVGFPGESEQDFEDTMALVREIEYAQAYSFKYSIRPGTPAAEDSEQIPEDIKSERLTRLQTLLNYQQEKFNHNSVGQKVNLLIEKPGKYDGQWLGKTPYLQSAHIYGDAIKIGDIITVEITEAFSNSVAAQIC